MLHYINLAYVQVHISMYVQEQDIVLEMVQHVMVNTPNALVPRIMNGVEVRVYVKIALSIHVVERVIVRERELRVEVSIKNVLVLAIIVGMVVHVFIHTHMCAQVGIVRLVQE